MSSGRKTQCDGTFWRLGCPSFVHRIQAHPGNRRFINNLYTKTKAMPRLRNLPPNSTNPLTRVQRAHMQTTLWKAADQHSPPDIYISNFRWEMKACVLLPCIDPGPTGPPALMDVISCRCRAAEKLCAAICSCKTEGLSCTIYCLR